MIASATTGLALLRRDPDDLEALFLTARAFTGNEYVEDLASGATAAQLNRGPARGNGGPGGPPASAPASWSRPVSHPVGRGSRAMPVA